MAQGAAPVEDLRLGYLAIANEFINLAELKWCLEVQGESEPGTTLGKVLVREGYLSKQDLEYLQMIYAARREHGDDDQSDPLLTATELTIDRIERAVVARLGRSLRSGSFGRFKGLGQVGRGGMGLVLKVQDGEAQDAPIVALKILVGSGGANVKDIERFKKEAAIMAQIRHDNIVQIYDVGREKGLDYIVMEYIAGVSLHELLEEGLPTLVQSLEIARGIAAALEFIHKRAVFHRDLKPANIMLEDTGRPVLMDFGLAVFEKFEVSGRRKGSVGTPQYQPPEQADVSGKYGTIGPASDVYGLGATLYHLVTGQPPFIGTERNEIRRLVLTTDPPTARSISPRLPAEVDRLIMKCLAKRPEDRYATPYELGRDIDRVLPSVKRLQRPPGQRRLN